MNKFLLLGFAVFTFGQTGCASLMNSATGKLADNLTSAILNQNDIETVRDGAPAYLLMIDGLIEGSPDNTGLLLSGSKLYGSYSSSFTDDADRSRRLADKALAYARAALCLDVPEVCVSLTSPAAEFAPVVAASDPRELPVLYGYATAWAGWMQAHSSDWEAIAELPKLTLLLERCREIDESFDDGAVHIYLGVLKTQLPPSLGGKPDEGRAHFERAFELSGGRNMMPRVLLAEKYARMVFDQELHDRVLREVLATPAEAPGLTLVNTLARQRASELLAESAEYF